MKRVIFSETSRALRVESVLDKEALERARQAGRKARYRPVPKGNGECLYLAHVPELINQELHQAMEFGANVRLEEIVSFYRLNTGELDTQFRVHTDAVIQDQCPTHACVFYLETSNKTGTALFEHPTHGRDDASRANVFDEDDGLWTSYFHNNALANSMFVYDSSLFHGRFPWKCEGSTRRDGRIVVVKFMKERVK